ncbi:MAG: 50S ribosomal protein L11 methyltransferase [Gammaproteobacteria bacterium]|nr:50S ribosomal protein L11 methyltransferase [Gammaproteobacteria bacterium]
MSANADATAAWRQLRFTLTIEHDAAVARTTQHPLITIVEQHLDNAGALSITLQDAGDDPVFEPLPGEMPTWQQTLFSVLFPAELDFQQILDRLKPNLEPLGAQHWHIESLLEQEWVRAWMDQFHAMQFGERLWICPHHLTPPLEAQIVIRLDPGLAFGTGTHPTTALCLQWLDQTDVTNKTVLDFGCGSGILAVAAAMLGAQYVNAIDIDPQALTATNDNAAQNNVSARIHTYLPQQYAADQAPVDIVLANILSRTLIALSTELIAAVKPGGYLIMSGILENQSTEVIAAFKQDFGNIVIAQQEGWLRIVAQCRLK